MFYGFPQLRIKIEKLASFIGHIYYDRSKGFRFDNNMLYLLDLPQDGEQIWYDHSTIVQYIDSHGIERFFMNMRNRSMGDIVFERFECTKGPFQGETFMVQGAVLMRDSEGKALYVTAHVSHISGPTAELFVREMTGDGLFLWNAETDEIYASATYQDMLGYSDDEFPKTFSEYTRLLTHPDDNDIFFLQERIVNSNQYGDSFECCVRLKHKNGNYIWTIGRGKVVERNSEGVATYLIGSQTNINLMTENFENIKLLMFSDSLTGLHNRTYFQQNLIYFDKADAQPMSIIFVDVTGLKLTNDILGHNYGDYLILKTSEIIQQALKLTNVKVLTPHSHNSETIDLGDAKEQEDEIKSDVYIDEYAEISESLDKERELHNLYHDDNNLMDEINEAEIIRLAGDEFIVILPRCNTDIGQSICNAILREQLSHNNKNALLPNHKRRIPILFGIGMACVGETGESDNFRQALERADMRMQEHKDRNRASNYEILREYFEMKKGRKVSMRDDRRLDIYTSEERAQYVEEQLDIAIC